MSYEDENRAALAQLFGAAVADHEDTTAECLSLLKLYSLTPQDLFYKFEAFALSSLPSSARTSPSLQDFRALRLQLQTSSTTSAAAATPKKDAFAYPGLASSAGRTSSARKMMGLGGLAGASSSSSSSSSLSTALHQTPSRPSALSRGGSNWGSTAGDDSMDMDDSPSRTQRSGAQREQRPWKITQSLNSSLSSGNGGSKLAPGATGSRVALAVGTDPRKWQYRYMFERGGERGEALDDLLEAFSGLLVEAYGISEEDLGDPSHVHQQSVYVVGRICPNVVAPTSSKPNGPDSTSGLPKLKPSHDGILLESSKLQGAGARLPVRFEKDCIVRRPPGMDHDDDATASSAAELLGVFPGMIVGLKGRNGGGDGFGAEEVLLLPALYQSSTPPSRLLELQHSRAHLSGQPLSIAVASGPYTSKSDLDFAAWHSLVDNLEREPVDVIVLMGPFVPSSHPSLPTSKLTPQDIFKAHFATRLNALTSSSGSTCTPILLPSVLDALSSHAAWPQPKYDLAELGLTKKTKLLPNPCLFSINEVVLGVSTADVLRDLRSEELVLRLKRQPPSQGQKPSSAFSQQTQKEDVLARAVRHILSQRSFYPVFPPPQPRSAADAVEQDPEPPLPLSLPHMDLAQWPTVTPDVLVLPSSLPPFAKIVDGTVVINPGHVGEGDHEAAHLARLTAHALPKVELETQVENGDEARMHDVWQRTRVDLLSL